MLAISLYDMRFMQSSLNILFNNIKTTCENYRIIIVPDWSIVQSGTLISYNFKRAFLKQGCYLYVLFTCKDGFRHGLTVDQCVTRARQKTTCENIRIIIFLHWSIVQCGKIIF